MKVISVSNIKGGVGKTSVTSTLAAGLAKKGYKVLMVDSDPQTNLSMCFLEELGEDDLSLNEIYEKRRTLTEVRVNIAENLDLIPGSFNLCRADMKFLGIDRASILKKAINALKDNYDYIVIDTPPNLGILSINAFVVSDYVVVPMAADTFSLKGVKLLREALDSVREETSKNIRVVGLLLTRYNGRTNLSKNLEETIQQASEQLETSVFEARIRQATAVAEAQLAKKDIFSFAGRTPVAEDYRQFVDEFLERTAE